MPAALLFTPKSSSAVSGKYSLREKVIFLWQKIKKKPFIIKSNESSIEVLGTQFNLKSYSNDNRIEVALLDGSVAFCYPSTTDQEMKCILSPGEQVYYNRTTHNLEKKKFYPIRLFFMERWKILFQKRNIGKYCQTVRAEFRCQHNYQKRFTQTNSLSHGICQQRNFRRHSIGHEFRRIFNNQTRW